jgi:hypothetical protein
MLRITPILADPHRCELRVEGRLAGESSLAVLREQIAEAAPCGRPLVLELSGVSFADQHGVALLATAARQGVALVGGSAWLTSLLGSVGGS